MESTIEVPTRIPASDEKKSCYYQIINSQQLQSLKEESDMFLIDTKGKQYWIETKYPIYDYINSNSLISDIALIERTGFSKWTDVYNVPSTIVSDDNKSIKFEDLLKESSILLPNDLFLKIKKIVTDLQKSEPMLFKYLLKMNNDIDIELIKLISSFIGADSMSDSVDIEDIFNEVKSFIPNGM